MMPPILCNKKEGQCVTKIMREKGSEGAAYGLYVAVRRDWRVESKCQSIRVHAN